MDTSIPDLRQPGWFVTVMLIFFVIIVGRYFLVSGLFYVIFYIWFPDKWRQRKINKKPHGAKQIRREMSWSMITASIFALTGTIMILLWQIGFTRIYTDVEQYPLWWLPLSLLVSLLIDETYYYWVHRWLHTPSVFRHIHKIHHQSNITSPWTAFSFHPLEGLLLSLSLPLTLFFIPMHPAVIIFQLTLMTVSSVVNHLDIELYPSRFHKHAVGRWLIGATHHGLHHRQFKYNFGLYFTFWDKLKKTESPQFDEIFENATSGSK